MSEVRVNTCADRPTIIPNKYVVRFKPDAEKKDCATHCVSIMDSAKSNLMRTAAGPDGAVDPESLEFSTFDLGHTCCGYSGYFDDETLEKVKADSLVHSIEPDQYVYPLKVTQENVPSWGLARLSHDGPLGSDQASKNYVYDEETDGHGTTAYIIDTGIYVDHEDFEGRASWGAVIPRGATERDFDGHGTHVAGTIGGKTFGVAKKAKLIAVKIFPDGANQGGSMSDILRGLEWAVKDAIERGDIHKCVANMSIGGGKTDFVNKAIANAVEAGLTVCVAAGNESRDAINTSPASAPDAITVGSLDRTDVISTFSNYGTILDIFAPGRNIMSCSNTGPTKSVALSGTSMATPHVAGLACSILTNGKITGPKKVLEQMQSIAEKQVVKGVLNNSPNILLKQVQPATEAPPPNTGDDETGEVDERKKSHCSTRGSEPSSAK